MMWSRRGELHGNYFLTSCAVSNPYTHENRFLILRIVFVLLHLSSIEGLCDGPDAVDQVFF